MVSDWTVHDAALDRHSYVLSLLVSGPTQTHVDIPNLIICSAFAKYEFGLGRSVKN